MPRGNPYVHAAAAPRSRPTHRHGRSIAFHLSEQGRDAAVSSDIRRMLRRLALASAGAARGARARQPGAVQPPARSLVHGVRVRAAARAAKRPAEPTGIGVGAYGVVEHIRDVAAARRAGAPGGSLHQTRQRRLRARAERQPRRRRRRAAVRPPGARAAGHGEAFSVDLSSQRVRRGLELLEGIRAGPAARGAARLPDRARGWRPRACSGFIAPVCGPRRRSWRTSSRPARRAGGEGGGHKRRRRADAARGCRLRRRRTRRRAKTLSAHHPALTPLPAPTRNALDRVLARRARRARRRCRPRALPRACTRPCRETPRAPGDRGRPVGRAQSAAGDRASCGPRGPASASRTGSSCCSGDSAAAADGWASSPRAVAEPRLEAWARACAASPDQIGVRARFVDDSGGEVAQLDDAHSRRSPSGGQTRAARTFRLGALDLVAAAPTRREPPSGLRSSCGCRARRAERPADAEEAHTRARLRAPPGLGRRRSSAFAETLEIARQLRDVIGRARALGPSDLASSGRHRRRRSTPRELAGRAHAAANALATAHRCPSGRAARTTTRPRIRQALFSADALGIAGAAPVTVRDAPGRHPRRGERPRRRARGAARQANAALAELTSAPRQRSQSAGRVRAALAARSSARASRPAGTSRTPGATAPFAAAGPRRTAPTPRPRAPGSRAPRRSARRRGARRRAGVRGRRVGGTETSRRGDPARRSARRRRRRALGSPPARTGRHDPAAGACRSSRSRRRADTPAGTRRRPARRRVGRGGAKRCRRRRASRSTTTRRAPPPRRCCCSAYHRQDREAWSDAGRAADRRRGARARAASGSSTSTTCRPRPAAARACHGRKPGRRRDRPRHRGAHRREP